jgi:uncharacterized NAD-dependent epimerase/dehydratase family protein
MLEDAIVLANGAYRTINGKVAHGLVRGSDRFRIRAVVDPEAAGEDAGVLLDGRHRGIPVAGSVPEALTALETPPRWGVIGGAPHGGRFTDELRKAALGALHSKMHLVCGLHDWASADPALSRAAADNGVDIIDLRKPPPIHELHFWSGRVLSLDIPRLAVLGMDCAIGKRTTARLLTRALNERGVTTEMIYTGQTGWLQGGRYGFIFDATPNDYVSGELEHAILRCAEESKPDLMILEGQSALRNPSGPCGAEFLLSGAAGAVVLQHAPARSHFDGFEEMGCQLPDVADEIDLISRYGARTLAVTLHGSADDADCQSAARELSSRLDCPVAFPLGGDLDPVVEAILAWRTQQ